MLASGSQESFCLGLTPWKLQKTLHLKAYDLLVSTNRNTDGRGYEQLKGALDRLSGTRIRTNIKTGEQEVTEGFGLIDGWRIVRQTASGRMTELTDHPVGLGV